MCIQDRITRLFLDVYAVSRDQHVVLLTCLEFLSEPQRKELVTKQRELIAYVRDVLLQIRPERAGEAARISADTMLYFGMINWTYTWYRADGPLAPRDLADRAVDLLSLIHN